MIKKALPLVLIVLSGCAVEKQADVDAQNALANNDYRLLQMPGRGTVLPGIDTSDRASAAKLCGVKILEGVSDVVRDEEALENVQRLTQYAERYNLLIYPQCKKAKQ